MLRRILLFKLTFFDGFANIAKGSGESAMKQ